MSNARLHRFVVAHLVTVVSEWAAIIGLLVYAFDWGGAPAVGFAALLLHALGFLAAPLVAGLTTRYSAHSIRMAGFIVQVACYGTAAVCSAIGLPLPVVAASVALGLGSLQTLRPSGAVLLPTIAGSTEGLVSGNLRVSYCDSVCALVGPLAAAALASLGGTSAVFVACTVAAALAVAMTAWRPSPAGRTRMTIHSRGSVGVMRAAAKELGERRWAVGVLGVSAARNIVIGAFDVLLVVVALRSLDLGDGGPALLSALVGAGAAVSVVFITFAVRRSRLRRALSIGLVCSVLLLVAVGAATSRPLVFITLPLIGVCLSMMENLSRMLLQRSTDVRQLGAIFACFGMVGGFSQLAGVGLAQGLLWLVDAERALVGVGLIVALIGLLTTRALADADAHADVPVVDMALLSSIPMFAPLPAQTLEAVARAGERRRVGSGEVVIRQGEAGDVFYAVAAGDFDISMNGVHIRMAPQGDFFGEVALLSGSPRTATVTALGDGELLAIHREPFLVAITGHEAAHATATAYVVDMDIEAKMGRTQGGSTEPA